MADTLAERAGPRGPMMLVGEVRVRVYVWTMALLAKALKMAQCFDVDMLNMSNKPLHSAPVSFC